MLRQTREIECNSEQKKAWLNFFKEFMLNEDYIPVELYRRWNDLVKTVSVFKLQKKTCPPEVMKEKTQNLTRSQTMKTLKQSRIKLNNHITSNQGTV